MRAGSEGEGKKKYHGRPASEAREKSGKGGTTETR